MHHEKSFEKPARLDLIATTSEICLTILNKEMGGIISSSRLPISEIFSNLNPENLKFDIIAPVYLM